MAKIGTNENCITCWPNLEPMLMAPPVGQILDWYKWSHIQLAKFGTNASGILFSLSNECNLWVSMWINGRGRYDHIFSDFHQLLRESSVCQSKIKTSSLLHSYTFSTLQYFWNISCCAFAFYNFPPLFMLFMVVVWSTHFPLWTRPPGQDQWLEKKE